VTLFVDTSVWSLALRRDAEPTGPEVLELRRALDSGTAVVTTGLVLQELLQGFAGPKDQRSILERFEPIPLVVPTRSDHVAAAELRNDCRRRGVQVGTIDALLAQICIRHGLLMLSTDDDFGHVARHSELRVWRSRHP
jgi:predicted nucleic acid-binding protein